MAQGKILHARREAQSGSRAFSTHSASVSAFRAGAIDRSALDRDSVVARRANRAKHCTSPAQLLPMVDNWEDLADYCTEDAPVKQSRLVDSCYDQSRAEDLLPRLRWDRHTLADRSLVHGPPGVSVLQDSPHCRSEARTTMTLRLSDLLRPPQDFYSDAQHVLQHSVDALEDAPPRERERVVYDDDALQRCARFGGKDVQDLEALPAD